MSKSLQTEMVQAGVHSLADMPDYVSVPKVPPIYMSSVFSFDDVPSLDAVYAKEAPGYVYSRDGNPGTDYTASMIAQAEGGESGLVFSSGMAASVRFSDSETVGRFGWIRFQRAVPPKSTPTAQRQTISTILFFITRTLIRQKRK